MPECNAPKVVDFKRELKSAAEIDVRGPVELRGVKFVCGKKRLEMASLNLPENSSFHMDEERCEITTLGEDGTEKIINIDAINDVETLE